MLEDQHLLRRLNRGDLDGLRCIYEKYKVNLKNIWTSPHPDMERPLSNVIFPFLFHYFFDA